MNEINNPDEEDYPRGTGYDGNNTPGGRKRKKRITRSLKNRILLGLCGGLGSYFEVSPIIFRFFFLFTLLLGSWGIAIYLVCSIIIPPEKSDELNSTVVKGLPDIKKLLGTILIILGFFLMLNNLDLSEHFSFLGFRQQFIFQFVLTLSIIFLALNSSIDLSSPDLPQTLSRSSEDTMISGVCGGFAKYLNANSLIIRSTWIIFTILTLGAGIIIYLIFVLILKDKGGTVSAE